MARTEVTASNLDSTAGTLSALGDAELAAVNAEASGPLATAESPAIQILIEQMRQLQENQARLAAENAVLAKNNEALKDSFRIELAAKAKPITESFFKLDIGFARDQVRPSENPTDDYQFMIEELADGRTCVWIPNFINQTPKKRTTKMSRIKMNNGVPVLHNGKPVYEDVTYDNWDVANTNIRATLVPIMVKNPTTGKLEECTFTAYSSVQARFGKTVEDNTQKADRADSAASIEQDGPTDESPTMRDGNNNEGAPFTPSSSATADDATHTSNRAPALTGARRAQVLNGTST